MKRAPFVAAALLVVGVPSRGLAQGASARPQVISVSIHQPNCDARSWTGADWLELLRVELATEGTRVVLEEERTAASAAEGVHIALDLGPCDMQTTSATLTLQEGGDRKVRVVDLGRIAPQAQGRALALAAAELIRSGVTPTAAEAPAARKPGTVPELNSKESVVRVDVHHRVTLAREPEPRASWSLFATGQFRIFPQGNAGLFGPRAGAIFPMSARWAFVLDGGALFGGAHDPLGEVDSALMSIGGVFLGGGGTGRLWFGMGPRLEGGVATFRGHAFEPSTKSSRATSGLVLLALSATGLFRISGALSGLVSIDVGGSLYGFGARADGRHATDFLGPMLCASVGASWDFASSDR